MVERPASVVKELLENALDAHSDRIDIDIERGGSALIRISDNGDGINKEDLSLAVTRHATSKLQTLSDLEQVNSLGFRGEALASISAVSKLSVKSMSAGQDQAWMVDTGTESDFADYSAAAEPVSHPQGTTIEVRDLFYNTPARRKFMRTVKTEFKHIDEMVKRIALSQFDTAFKLTHNKKIIRNLPKAVTEKAVNQRISKLFSPEFLSHTNKVDYKSNHFSQMGTIHLWGWVSISGWHRNQSDWQYFYVNGRYIKDRLVNHALRQAYQELLPADTYAAYILYLQIAPQQVDVNVHPTKHEVRFRQTRLVHDFIYSALNQAIHQQADDTPLLQTNLAAQAPSSELRIDSIDAIKQKTYDRSVPSSYRHSDYRAEQSPISQHIVAEQLDGLQQLYGQGVESNGMTTDQINTLQSHHLTPAPFAPLLFGQTLGCLIPNYLLTQNETDKGLIELFVININKAQQFLLAQLFHPGEQISLLIPISISLAETDIELLLKYQSELSEQGIEFSQLSAQTLLLRSLPSLYTIPGCEIDSENLIQILLSKIASSAEADFSLIMQDALKLCLTTQALSLSQQKQLLNLLSHHVNQLESVENFIRQQSIWVVVDELALDKLFVASKA